MKPVILKIIIFYCLLVSCYKPYNANIEADKRILVVDGMITNENKSYNIHLSYALPFNSSDTVYYADVNGQPVNSAEVHVTDDHGKYYTFIGWGNGNYISEPVQFTGHPGNSYTLHITTYDGETYESNPQQLYPESSPDSVYAEFDYQETISKIDGLKTLSHGANILTDIKNHEGKLPHLRFTTNLLTQYYYSICPPFQSCYFFYCWQTDVANPGINLTGGNYSVNSASISKHAVCFIDDNLYCFALTYGIDGTSEYQSCMVSSRIIYLTQYALNNETYLYYKSVDEQLQSNGKLFDPIAVQLNSNIKCIGHPDKKVFGFFEASSVTSSAYTLDFRNLKNNQPSITKIPYILPPEPTGYWINNVPPFWVYY